MQEPREQRRAQEVREQRRAQEAREEKRRAQEAREQRRTQEAREREVRTQEEREREREVRVQEEREREVRVKEERERDVRAQRERQLREWKTEERREHESEVKAQGGGQEEDASSMHKGEYCENERQQMCRTGTWCGGESLRGSGWKTDHTREQQGTDEERGELLKKQRGRKGRQRKKEKSTPAPKHQCNYHSNSNNRCNAVAMTDTLATVVEETTAGALELKETVTEGELLFFAVDVNDDATESKIENTYCYRYSLNDDIMRATNVMIDRKCALVHTHCDVGEVCNYDLRDSGARAFLVECDPICALQACIEVLKVAPSDSVASKIVTLFPQRAHRGSGARMSLPIETPLCL